MAGLEESMFPGFGVVAWKFSVLSPESVKKWKRKQRGWRAYCAGPGGPVTGPGGWLGDGPVVPAIAILAVRLRLNRKAKTPPTPAATATAMNIAVRNPTLLAGWKYAVYSGSLTILYPL